MIKYSLEAIPSGQLNDAVNLICKEVSEANVLKGILWGLKQRIHKGACSSLEELSQWRDESFRLLHFASTIGFDRRERSQETTYFWSRFFNRCHRESWPVPDSASFYESVMSTVDLTEEDLTSILIRGTKIKLTTEHLEEIREQRHLKTLLNVMGSIVAIAPPREPQAARFFLLAFAAKELLP